MALENACRWGGGAVVWLVTRGQALIQTRQRTGHATTSSWSFGPFLFVSRLFNADVRRLAVELLRWLALRKPIEVRTGEPAASGSAQHIATPDWIRRGGAALTGRTGTVRPYLKED